MKGGKL
ncbi:hypothetical protein AYI70_g2318, partial [Smittium culicis]